MNINNTSPMYPHQGFEQHMGDIPFATVRGSPNHPLNEPSQRQQVPVSSVTSTHSSPRFNPVGVVSSSPFNHPAISDYMSNHGNNNQPTGNNSVFVGDLSYFCTEIELASLFSPFGSIISVEIKRGRHGDSLMHGFVEFVNNDEAHRAIQEINGIKFMGRKIRVNWANQKVPHNADADTWIQVHVNFLTPHITMKVNEEFLETVFLPFGSLGDVVVKRHLSSPLQVTGYAFVYFYDIHAALRAIFAFKNNGNGTSSYSANSVNNVFFDCCLSYKAERFLTENMQGIAGVIKRQQSSNPSAFFKQLEHSQPRHQHHLPHHSAVQPSSLHQLQPPPQHSFSQISSLPPSPPQFQVPLHAQHVNSYSRMNTNGNVMNENHHNFAKSSSSQSMLLKSSVPTSAFANHTFVTGATNGHAFANVPTSASTTALRNSSANFANIEGFQQHYFAKMGISNPFDGPSSETNMPFSSAPITYNGDQPRKVTDTFVPSKPVAMHHGTNEIEPNRNFLLGQFHRPLSSANNLLTSSESQGYTNVAGSKSMDYFSSSNNSSSNSIQLNAQNVASFPANSNVGSQRIMIDGAEPSLNPSRVTTTMRVTSGADFETLFADVSK